MTKFVRGLFLCGIALAIPWWAQAQAPTPPAASLQLVAVHSAKVLYETTEPITGTVTVKNTSKTAQEVTVRAWLECEIDRSNKPQQQTQMVAPGKTADAPSSGRKDWRNMATR